MKIAKSKSQKLLKGSLDTDFTERTLYQATLAAYQATLASEDAAYQAACAGGIDPDTAYVSAHKSLRDTYKTVGKAHKNTKP